jgi:GNAT superfamily N-acetyltransferase
MSIDLRPFDFSDTDYEAMVSIGMANFPDDINTVVLAKEYDSLVRVKGKTLFRIVAVDGDTTPGYGHLRHIVWSFHPNRYWFFVAVHPDRHGEGIGSAICEQLFAEARRLGAAELHSAADDDKPRAVRFLDRRGFVATERDRESRLDLNEFDPDRFSAAIDRVARSGITIAPFIDLQRTVPDWFERFYDLYTTVEADAPWELEYTRPSEEDFRKTTVGSDSFRPEATFIARDGDRWIGLTELRIADQGEHPLFQELTGTIAEYRRRGIATALKARGVAWGKEAGFSRLGTWNSTMNAPMLAVNEKLGFRKLREAVSYKSELEA